MRTLSLSAWIITFPMCQDLGHPAGTHTSLPCVKAGEQSLPDGGGAGGASSEDHEDMKALPGSWWGGVEMVG